MTATTGESRRFDVIVIGAGANGLTTAALLAKAGRKVLVLERRGIVGGLAAVEEFHPGYRTAGMLQDTTGVRPAVIEALSLQRHGLALRPHPPAVFSPQKNGRGLLLHHDPSAAAEEIAAHSARDADQYVRYRQFLARIGKFTMRVLDEVPPDMSGNARSLPLELMGRGFALRRLGRHDMLELMRLTPMCVADWLNEWFETEPLKCVLAGPAIFGTFMGPWSPGSNANLVRWEGLASRPSAGEPGMLIAALEKAARSHGVDIRTNAEVGSIRIAGGQVEGVTLADGESIDASMVAASCDPKQTFLEMIATAELTPGFEHRIDKLRMTGTTAKVNLALNAPLRFACRPELEVERACLAESIDDMERAFDAIKYGRFSDSPILEVYVPTAANPDFAPPGHSVASIVVHFAPYHLQAGWNDEQRAHLGKTVTEVMKRHVPDLDRSIVATEVLSPPDIEKRYGVTLGHIHHGDHALDQLLTRPSPECARYATPIAGLYLCGSGTHPGGGLTCGPGALAASVMLKRPRS